MPDPSVGVTLTEAELVDGLQIDDVPHHLLLYLPRQCQ